MTENKLPKLTYSKEESAEMLGVKISSLEWLLRKKLIPCRKIAGKIRFTINDLYALIESSAVTSCCAADMKGR